MSYSGFIVFVVKALNKKGEIEKLITYVQVKNSISSDRQELLKDRKRVFAVGLSFVIIYVHSYKLFLLPIFIIK